jgi:nucleotide-binding universal stress UspA family protein
MIREQEVIAVIEEAATARRCLTIAERAVRVNAGFLLTALHICADPEKLSLAAEEFDIQKMRELNEGTAEERLARARHVFEDWSVDCGAQVKWLEPVGNISASLIEAVKSAALIVIAQPNNLDSSDALHAAIFDTERPVLFIPKAASKSATLGNHMLIAWKSRPQVRKVIQNTLPWLRAAQRVTLVTVNESEGSHDIDEALHLLSENGIHAEVRQLSALPGEHVADRLLREAEALGADSIVIGAYRFFQIVEWIIGGVTRELLDRANMPVFMMH